MTITYTVGMAERVPAHHVVMHDARDLEATAHMVDGFGTCGNNAGRIRTIRHPIFTGKIQQSISSPWQSARVCEQESLLAEELECDNVVRMPLKVDGCRRHSRGFNPASGTEGLGASARPASVPSFTCHVGGATPVPCGCVFRLRNALHRPWPT